MVNLIRISAAPESPDIREGTRVRYNDKWIYQADREKVGTVVRLRAKSTGTVVHIKWDDEEHVHRRHYSYLHAVQE